MKGISMISYEKLLKLCEKQHINSYTMKKESVIGQQSWKKIQSGKFDPKTGAGNIDMQSLNALCKYLKCQPGDLLEFVDESVEK